MYHPRVFAAQVPGQGRQEGTSRQRGSYEGAQPAPPRGALPHRPITPSPGTCWLGYAALATVGPPARPGDPLTAGSSLHQGLGAWGQAGAPGTPPPSAPSVLQRKCRQGTGWGGAWKAVAPVPTDARPQPGAGVGELPGRETQAQAETPGDDGGPWGPEQGHRTRAWGPGLYWLGTCWCGCSVPGRPAGTQGPALGLQQEALRLQSNEGCEGSARQHPEIQARGPPSS